MRHFLKSMFRFTWSMSLFGANSMGNLMVRSDSGRGAGKMAEALDSVARAAEEQLHPWLKSLADTGNRIQEGVANFAFGSPEPIPGGTESPPPGAK